MYDIFVFLVFVSSIQNIENKADCPRSCSDGTCIPWTGQCDGKVDCPDGSDETEKLCQYENCEAHAAQTFQCAYGACVSRNAPCDGVKDCVDNSDELLLWCPRVTGGNFKCDTNTSIGKELLCDSHKDCPDGSDETEELCGRLSCRVIREFQCKYGACIPLKSSCDGKMDCPDGSDETLSTCEVKSCTKGQYRCRYGGCIPTSSLCDGKTDCVDNSDEKQPWCRNITDGKFTCQDGGRIKNTFVCNGEKECADGSDETASLCETTICNDKQFQCKYGGCIPKEDACNAVLDCFDGSDETEEQCRDNLCSGEQFQCSYGGCVSRSARCDGVKDCIDNSDEQLPWCANIRDGKFICENISVAYQHRIDTELVCDGLADCADRSDEAAILCSLNSCHRHQFRCGYGACISLEYICDGQTPGPNACSDESDEAFGLCNNTRCFFPPKPDNGRWSDAMGDYIHVSAVNYESLTVRIVCDEGFTVFGEDTMSCKGGVWSKNMPQCVRYCTIPKDPSVTFLCASPEPEQEFRIQEIRVCHAQEQCGAVALPSCSGPSFYATQALPHMSCVNGTWDYIANCTIDCGTVTPSGKMLISGGLTAKHGDLPWHAAIYKKQKKTNRQICGGSLIHRNVVISAAHCFWKYDQVLKKYVKQPPHNYVVAVGMIYRRWNHPEEINAQRSDVSELIIPAEFEGEDRNYQADIAVVKVATPFEYKPYIRPVCLSFDAMFEEAQLAPGNKGKVAGWGLTGEDDRESPILNVIDLPFIDEVNCSETAPPNFKQYLTLDKFCVGYLNQGIAVCKGDSGGGMVFPQVHDGVERFFLRGVVSTAPQNNHKCNVNVYTAMTRVSIYEYFVKQNY